MFNTVIVLVLVCLHRQNISIGVTGSQLVSFFSFSGAREFLWKTMRTQHLENLLLTSKKCVVYLNSLRWLPTVSWKVKSEKWNNANLNFRNRLWILWKRMKLKLWIEYLSGHQVPSIDKVVFCCYDNSDVSKCIFSKNM